MMARVSGLWCSSRLLLVAGALLGAAPMAGAATLTFEFTTSPLTLRDGGCEPDAPPQDNYGLGPQHCGDVISGQIVMTVDDFDTAESWQNRSIRHEYRSWEWHTRWHGIAPWERDPALLEANADFSGSFIEWSAVSPSYESRLNFSILFPRFTAIQELIYPPWATSDEDSIEVTSIYAAGCTDGHVSFTDLTCANDHYAVASQWFQFETDENGEIVFVEFAYDDDRPGIYIVNDLLRAAEFFDLDRSAYPYTASVSWTLPVSPVGVSLGGPGFGGGGFGPLPGDGPGMPAIPLPAAGWMTLAGLAALAGLRRRGKPRTLPL